MLALNEMISTAAFRSVYLPDPDRALRVADEARAVRDSFDHIVLGGRYFTLDNGVNFR